MERDGEGWRGMERDGEVAGVGAPAGAGAGAGALSVVKPFPSFFRDLSKSLSQSESRKRLHNYSKFHHS